MIIVETTFNKKEDAEFVVNFLLEKKLIACATYKNVESSYVWKDDIKNEEEIEVSLHTSESLFTKVVENVKEKHPYELPRITTIHPLYTLPEYEDWVNKETTN